MGALVVGSGGWDSGLQTMVDKKQYEAARVFLADAVRSLTGFETIYSMNDNPKITHDEVMKVFDHAIEKAKTAVG